MTSPLTYGTFLVDFNTSLTIGLVYIHKKDIVKPTGATCALCLRPLPPATSLKFDD